MKKTILGVLLLLSPISVGFSQTYQKPTGETMLYRGTLIVVVPTKEGLVVCADRRLHNDSKGDTDTGLKIRPFEGGVFAASGYVIWPGGITGTIDLFSATEFALAQKKDAPVAWNSAQGLPNVGVEPFKVVDTTGLLLPREIGSQINAMSPDGVSPPLNQQLIWPTRSGIDLNALSSWKLPSSLSALVVGTNRSLGGIDWSNYLNSVTPLGGPSRGDSTIELIRGLGRPSTPFDLAHAEALPLYPLGIPPSTPTSLHESLSVLTQNTPNAISILGYDPTASRISSKPEHTGVNPDALRMYSQLSDAVSHRMGIIDESPLKGLDKVYVSPVLPNNFGAIDVLVQPETTLPSNKLSLPQEWQTGLYPYVPVNRTDSLSEAVKRYSEGDSQIRTQDFLTPLHIVPNLFAIPPPGSLLDGSKKELPQDWLKNFTPSKPPLMLDFTNPGFLPRNEVRLPESKGLGKSGASTVATLANASPDSFIGDDSFDDRMRRVAEYLGSQLHFLTESNIKISEFGTMPNNQFFEVRFFYATAAGQLQEQVLICRLISDVFSNVRNWEITVGTPTDDLLISKPLFSGSPELYFELLDGKDHRYDDLRSNPFIKPFLSSPRPRDQVTVNEALAFSHTLIEATSKRGGEINKDIHVSESCNCGLLDHQGRFKWISASNYPLPRSKPKKK